MNIIDISDLKEEDKKIIIWLVDLIKENQYLKQTVKDMSKLI